jgi:hypothetical protein
MFGPRFAPLATLAFTVVAVAGLALVVARPSKNGIRDPPFRR